MPWHQPGYVTNMAFVTFVPHLISGPFLVHEQNAAFSQTSPCSSKYFRTEPEHSGTLSFSLLRSVSLSVWFVFQPSFPVLNPFVCLPFSVSSINSQILILSVVSCISSRVLITSPDRCPIFSPEFAFNGGELATLMMNLPPPKKRKKEKQLSWILAMHKFTCCRWSSLIYLDAAPVGRGSKLVEKQK